MVNALATGPLRADLKLIADLVPTGSKVLDIGCGDGSLLEALRDKGVDGRGLELEQSKVSACVARGLSVIQGDAETDLVYYPDASFDVAILSNTLQATRDPRTVLLELVRIARRGIVGVPNFGYWENRLHLLVKGRMPVTRALTYQWYDTPNIHFCTLKDFGVLCEEVGLTVVSRHWIGARGAAASFAGNSVAANLLGQQGVFEVEKR